MKRIMIVVIFTLSLSCGVVNAASQGTPVGIAVSPAIVQLHLEASQDQADFTEDVTNNTANAVQIKIGFADFKALNESGGIAFLGQNASAVEESHGLAKWVDITTQQIGLQPGQSSTVQVHLSDLSSLPEGGHYGALTYQVLKAVPNGSGNRVSVNQVISSLVFLTTAGKGTEHLKMPPPALHPIEFSLPSELDLFFTNDGNTQTIPRGTLAIYNHDSAHPSATAVVNTQQAMVLPNSTRLLQTPITVTGHPWWPGRYHMRISYRPDSVSSFQTYDTSFFYINPWLFPVLLVLAVAAWYILPRLWRSRGKSGPAVRLLRKLLKHLNHFVVEVVLAGIAHNIVKFQDRKKTSKKTSDEAAKNKSKKPAKKT